MIKDNCPLCNRKLVKRHQGLVCKNGRCELYFKCNVGWVYLNGKRSRNENIINGLWNSNKRNMFAHRWATIKDIIIKRDDYKCRFCGYCLTDDFFHENGLNIHHIVPSSQQSALYFDKDNLITVCNECHHKLHSCDKYIFTKKGDVNKDGENNWKLKTFNQFQ